jgi:hypothetical protein
MHLLQLSFISGMMVGIEIRFLEPRAPFHYSIVLDLLIFRVVIQKFKNVR